ncbi:lipid IV(A) 3-deoxy-D-manno-octulosonic acid transferase [Cupriavidus sp. 30B13]|uniref:lipid IV(A) 3-deoxy-D-manno-octulosonic acid transferase n=1 Tax=Cupriavidus sp. 30B13 TaxID=3384241 RepID=UPI003B91A11C
MLRALYNLLWLVALPVALLRLVWRGRKEPGYVRHVGERLGAYGKLPAAGPWLWVHAVSVGETRAAQPLIEALLASYPSHRLLLTHMTPTGRQTGAQLFGAQPRVTQCYLPYDLPWLVRRFLRYFRPVAGMLMETEVWPSLVRGARLEGVPLLLVNARLSPRSYRRTARFGQAATAMYRDFTAVLAQTQGDAERFRALGLPAVEVTGNLKFDMEPPEAGLRRGRLLRKGFGARAVFAATSTREGEEALVLAAFARWLALAAPAPAAVPRPALLLVPRHPQRFDEVAALVARQGFSLQRRSAFGDAAGWEQSGLPEPVTADVLLGDSMGEMALYFAASDLAFIGGSLLPLGGQNLIEACAAGTPVLIGPHTFNFAQATEDAIAAGACRRVADADELMRTAATVLGDAPGLAAMRDAARAFSVLHRGATQRTMAALAQVIGAAR